MIPEFLMLAALCCCPRPHPAALAQLSTGGFLPSPTCGPLSAFPQPGKGDNNHKSFEFPACEVCGLPLSFFSAALIYRSHLRGRRGDQTSKKKATKAGGCGGLAAQPAFLPCRPLGDFSFKHPQSIGVPVPCWGTAGRERGERGSGGEGSAAGTGSQKRSAKPHFL